MARYVILLRGINVGGKNRLPMAALTTHLTELGCNAVRTYIQSGNAVVDAPAAVGRCLPQHLSERLATAHDLQVPVVVRNRAGFERAASEHPLAKGVEESALAVAFLRDRPKAAQVSALGPDRSPGDTFTVKGNEIYLCLPNGAARSKLTNAWFDRVLDTVSTTRNWRTTQALLEMLRGDLS